MNGGSSGFGAPQMRSSTSGMRISSADLAEHVQLGESAGAPSWRLQSSMAAPNNMLTTSTLPAGACNYPGVMGTDDLAMLANDMLLGMALNAQHPTVPGPAAGPALQQLLSARTGASGAPPPPPPPNAAAPGLGYGAGNAGGLGVPASPLSGGSLHGPSLWPSSTGGPSHHPSIEGVASWHGPSSNMGTSDESLAALLLAYLSTSSEPAAGPGPQWVHHNTAGDLTAQAALHSGLISPPSLPGAQLSQITAPDLGAMGAGSSYIQLRPWSDPWRQHQNHLATGAGPSAAPRPVSHDLLTPYLQCLPTDDEAAALARQHAALLDHPRLNPSSWAPALVNIPTQGTGGLVGGRASASGLPVHPHSVGGVLGAGAARILSGGLLSAGALAAGAGPSALGGPGPSGVSSASAQLQSCINRRLSLGTQGAAAAALLSGQPPAAQMQPATQAMHSAELAQHAGGVPRVAPATWLSAFTPLDLGPSVAPEPQASQQEQQELVSRAVAAASQLLQSLQVASQENLQALSLGGGSSSLGAGVSTAAGAAAAAPAAAGGTAAGSGQSQEVQQPAQGREEEAAGATNAGAAAAGTDGGDGAGGAGGEGTGANAQLGAETPVLGGRHSRHKLYKTEMCRNWTAQGACPYGVKCQFAHGPQELRVRVSKTKKGEEETDGTTEAGQNADPAGGSCSPSGTHSLTPEASDRPSGSSDRTSAQSDRPSALSDIQSFLSGRTSAVSDKPPSSPDRSHCQPGVQVLNL